VLNTLGYLGAGDIDRRHTERGLHGDWTTNADGDACIPVTLIFLTFLGLLAAFQREQLTESTYI